MSICKKNIKFYYKIVKVEKKFHKGPPFENYFGQKQGVGVHFPI